MNQTPDDPLIDEVRAARRMISAEHGDDPAQLVAYYEQLQKTFGDRVVKPAKSDEAKDPSAA